MAELGFDPTGAPTLRRGGGPADWVTFLQQVLAPAGTSPGAADSDFGPATQQAVEAFQAATGLVADGIVGPATWQALAEALGASSAGTASGNRFDPATAPVLRRGSRGDFVSYLQELLIAAGHDPGPVDGIFGPRTEAAVREFQQANGLQVDGVVGIQTWTALDPIAEAHPTDPPVGSPVHSGGAGGGSTPGGTVGDARVSVAATPDSTIGDEGLRITTVVSNDSTGSIHLIRLEREVLGQGGSIKGALDLDQDLGAGQTSTVVDTVPMGRAPDGETFVITIASVAVFDAGDGVQQRSPENLEAFTIDDQGNVTAGGDAPSSGGEPTTAGDHLTVGISPADRVVDGSLQIEFPTTNVSTVNAFISGLDWSVQSGNDQFNRQGDHNSPIGPGESVGLSDVVPMGPAADEPFAITITATVTYFLDDGTERRSAPAQRTVTIDAQGVVGGSGGGGGTGSEGTPSLRLVIDAFSVANVLGCNATVVNDGDGVADDVHLTGTLSGPSNDHKERTVPTLSPSEGSVVELGAQLPADRTDTLLFVFEAQVTSTNAAGASESTGITVAPDGTVTRG